MNYPCVLIFLLFSIVFPLCRLHAYQAGTIRTRKTSERTIGRALAPFNKPAWLGNKHLAQLSETQAQNGPGMLDVSWLSSQR